jgi:hypothetical protein
MTHPPATQNDPDPSTTNGRSVIYPNSTIYVGNGKFWQLDAFGKSAGPF